MNSNTTATGLRFDAAGFLVGSRRLAMDVQQIETNTQKILDILEKQQRTLQEGLAPLKPTAMQKLLLEANLPVIDALKLREQQQRTNRNSSSNNDTSQPRRINIPRADEVLDSEQLRRNSSVSGRAEGSQPSGAGNRGERSRDSRGRWIGAGGSGEQNRVEQLYTKLASLHMNADTSRIDPTVDALKELGGMLSPVRKVASFALKPLSGLFKNRKRKEPLPEEQSDHNREELSLLKRILKTLGLQRSNNGSGGLFGLPFGGGLMRGAGKLLKSMRGLPIIGALAAGLSLYDWNEQTTEEKGGTVGSLAGGTAGAALGSVLGPVGTIAGGMGGAWLGKKLGEVVAPKVEKWTKTLIAADLPGRMSAAWDTLVTGLREWFKQKIEGIKEFGANAGTAVAETGKQAADSAAGFIDKGLAFFGNDDAKMRVQMRKEGKLGYKPPGKRKPKQQKDNITLGNVIDDTTKALMTQPEASPTVDASSAISSDLNARMKQTYDAAIGAGFSHRQAVALIGEVGRENDFKIDKMFGSHKDPARGNNLGVFSWQESRRKNLVKYLGDRGFMNKDGTIQRSKAALQAQFEFLHSEIANRDKWKKSFLDKKDISIPEARKALGGVDTPIGWAFEQDRIKKKDGTLVPFDWRKQLNKANDYSKLAGNLDSFNSNKIKIQTPTTPTALATFAQNADIPTIGSTIPATPVITPNAKISMKPAYVPPKPVQPVDVPNLKKIGGSDVTKVHVINSNDSISQNISDRLLAHAVTGGLGMRENA